MILKKYLLLLIFIGNYNYIQCKSLNFNKFNNIFLNYFNKKNFESSILNKIYDTGLKTFIKLQIQLDNYCLKKNINKGYGISFKQKQDIININKDKFNKTELINPINKEERDKLIKEIVISQFSYELYNIDEQYRRTMEQFTADSNQLTLIINVTESVLKNLPNNQINSDVLKIINKTINDCNNIYKVSIENSLRQKKIHNLENHTDPILMYDNIIRQLKKDEDDLLSLIYKNHCNFRHPLGKIYFNYSFLKENFLGYKKFLGNELVLNTLFLLGFNVDPFVCLLDKEKDLKYLFNIYILGGIQMPEMLTILPSNGLLYLKLFLSLGIIFDDNFINIISGMVFFVGFGTYGYLKFELLNNIHGLVKLTKDFIEFITSFNKILDFFNKNFKDKVKIFSSIIYENISIFNITFIVGKNNNKFSPLTKLLKEKVQKAMNNKLKQEKKEKNINYMLQLS